MKQPNIVFIMADQWAAASVGCYGCDVPNVTPHLDAMAEQGIRFTRHYVNIPVCGPSRASIFTGRSPVAHGVVHNNIDARPETPFFTDGLRTAGYKTVGIGKFHFTPMQQYPPSELGKYGFDEVLITEDTKHGPWLEWIKNEHTKHYETALAMAWPMPYIDTYPPNAENLRPAWGKALETYIQPQQQPPYRRICYPSPLPVELHQTTWITDCAIDKLDTFDKEGAEEPFFLFVSYVDPHDPYDPPSPYAEMFAPGEIPSPIPQEWTRDYCAQEYPLFQDTMFQLSSFDDDTWARLRALFYGSCRFVDDSVGRILEKLRQTGLDENTIVIFTTDHGDLIGDHGMLMKGPWHYDKTIRCPLIVYGSGVAQGEICDELTSNLDLAPTVLNLAGISCDLEGNRLPLETNQLRSYSGWKEIAIESNASYVNKRGGCHSIVSDDGWRLTLFLDQQYGELFNLMEDPDEQNNLFLSPQFQSKRLELSERLIKAREKQIYPFPGGEFADL
jgi:arylsulfatase